MKTQIILLRNHAIALGALALLGGAFVSMPVRAQDAAAAPADTTKPVSLNLVDVPIQDALRVLFSSAGIRNYNIDSDVHGFANINVSGVPFSLALRQMLSSVTPPVTSVLESGIYHIKVLPAVPAPAPVISAPAAPKGPDTDPTNGTADAPKGYVSIGITKFDAYYIATLIGRTGIVQVGINDVVASAVAGGSTGNGSTGNGSAFGGNNRGGNTRGGNTRGGFGGGASTPISSVGGSGITGGGGMTGGFTGGFGGPGF